MGYDSNSCDPIGYEPLKYKNTSEILECHERTLNCTKELEDCVKPLHACLDICVANLTTYINELDETELYQTYADGNLAFINQTLSTQYDASLEDFKSIQLYHQYLLGT